MSEKVDELLESWGTSILQRDSKQSDLLKDKVEEVVQTRVDTDQKKKYLVLAGRYYLLKQDSVSVENIIQQLENSSDLLYYVHFFKGVNAYNNKKFGDAVEYFSLAEQQLGSQSLDEQAEFHYKLASVLYHLRENLAAVEHIKQGLKIFEKDEKYLLRQSDCRMLLGLNYIDMKQFLLAEEELHRARDIAVKSGNKGLLARVNHNLGLLYAEQNHSQTAIRYLSDVVESGDHDHSLNNLQAVFLITREYFKDKKVDVATDWLGKGVELADSLGSSEYGFKFRILQAIYLNELDVEKTFKEGISFFKREKLWVDVEEYAQMLARFYLKHQKYKEATEYYEIAIEASEEIKKLEALK